MDVTNSQLESSLNLTKKELKEKESYLGALECELKTKNELILRLENDLENNNGDVLENDKNLINNNGISRSISGNDGGQIIRDDKEDQNDADNYSIKIRTLEDILEDKDKRIVQLEDGLRESVQISTEREQVLQNEEAKRRQIMEKVGKLEQRLLSLQSAQAMRCHNCKPYVRRTSLLEEKLLKLIAERKTNLQELTHMKRDALEAAISEKDAHLALIEMTGIRNARQAEEADNLRLDKKRLVDLLKKEAESSISLLEETDMEDEISSNDLANENLQHRRSPENYLI